MKKFSAVFLALVMFMTSAPLWAHSSQQGDIQIGHIWARATAQGAQAASVYVPLLNKGKNADRLLDGTTPIATGFMLHESTIVDGVSHMTMLDDLLLPPNQPVAMRPGAKHIMLTGLKQQLKEGDTFPLTLHFEHAGTATVQVMVHAASATSGNH